MRRALRIAVVGDVHMCWGERDRRGLDAADYDLALFVGDLAGYVGDGLAVARSIARLRTPALLIAGNHDGVSVAHLASEVFSWSLARRVLERSQPRRCRALGQALGDVPLAGYGVHRFVFGAQALNVLVARPHSLGGERLAFARYLAERFGVQSMAESTELLCGLVDELDDAPTVVLAHNGPAGLGGRRDDIWGCDFRREQGDFGDPDLAAALAYARQHGKRVVAVAAGHMHHRLKGGGERRWRLERDGVLYLNAARVPRVERRGRHHLCLRLDDGMASVEAQWF
jgi:uncharacterized protein (TIGR04168 family)